MNLFKRYFMALAICCIGIAILWPGASLLASKMEVEVPYNSSARFSLDFEAPDWQSASTIDSFERMGSFQVMGVSFGESADNQTRVFLQHNGEALLIGFICLDDDIENIGNVDGINQDNWSPVDVIELFFDGDLVNSSGYHHLVFSAGGEQWQARTHDRIEPAGWEVKTKLEGDKWKAVVRIPFVVLGLDPEQELFKGIIYRSYHPHDRPNRERSSWGGGTVHNTQAFGKFKLGSIQR